MQKQLLDQIQMKHRMLLTVLIAVLVSMQVWAAHPSMDGSAETAHPAVPLPDGVQIPRVDFDIYPDTMDGYNLLLSIGNFSLLPPLADTPDIVTRPTGEIMQGHIHLYVNGKKIMRVYGEALHLPSALLSDGINSITLSVNDHRHGVFTLEDKEIQSTKIIDTRSDILVKSSYSWPASVGGQ